MQKFINVRDKITPAMTLAQEAHALPQQPSIPRHRNKNNIQVAAGVCIKLPIYQN